MHLSSLEHEWTRYMCDKYDNENATSNTSINKIILIIWQFMTNSYIDSLLENTCEYSIRHNYNVTNDMSKCQNPYYNIMQLKKIFFYKDALLMFRVTTSSAPSVFRELFIENRNVHDYFTKQHDKYHVPNAKRNCMQRTISYRGVIVWNHITSKHVTYDRSLLSFKFALWKYVFNDDTLLDPV